MLNQHLAPHEHQHGAQDHNRSGIYGEQSSQHPEGFGLALTFKRCAISGETPMYEYSASKGPEAAFPSNACVKTRMKWNPLPDHQYNSESNNLGKAALITSAEESLRPKRSRSGEERRPKSHRRPPPQILGNCNAFSVNSHEGSSGRARAQPIRPAK
jgi:hypothetical protein